MFLSFNTLMVVYGHAVLWSFAVIPIQFASAQTQPLLVLDSIAGLAADPGVTVLSRLHPDYNPPGIRAGSFLIRPRLEESFGYDSNVTGARGGPGGWIISTAPSVSIGSNWERNSLGATVAAVDLRYSDQPAQSRTDWTAGVNGGVTIGRHELTLAFDHLSLHEDRTQLGAVASDRPLPYQVEDLRSAYAFDVGRLVLEPRLDARLYRFGDATIGGATTAQGFRDRNQVQASLTARYQVADLRSIVALIRATGTNYTQPAPGQPSQDAIAYEALAGVDRGGEGAWRYRLLAGVGVRDFASPSYKNQVSPIAEADVIWTPTGMTTVSAMLSRTVQDPTVEGTAASTYTSARLAVDHEYLRNVILQSYAGYQRGEFDQPSETDDLYSAGAGMTWLLNRNLRLSLTYDYTDKRSSAPSNSYVRGVGLLRVRFAL